MLRRPSGARWRRIGIALGLGWRVGVQHSDLSGWHLSAHAADKRLNWSLNRSIMQHLNSQNIMVRA
jgi:hypothetical protein